MTVYSAAIMAMMRAAAHGQPACIVRDTAAYTNDIYAGRLACLYCADTLVDSIETAFGLPAVGADSVVYLKVETLNRGMLRGTYFTKLILFCRGQVSVLSDSLPLYNEHFSSPAVVDSSLYYWGLGAENIYAMRFNVRKARLDSIRLNIQGSVITDAPDYFGRPKEHSGGILFAVKDGQKFVVSRDWRKVREIGGTVDR